MTDERLQEFLKYFDEVAKHAQKLSYLVRDRKLQMEQIEKLKTCFEELNYLKVKFVDDHKENEANICLSLEERISAVSHELQMYIDIKDDDIDSAWENLIKGQMNIKTAIQAFPSNFNGLEAYAKRLLALEKILFPPQVFHSAGMIVKESHCSICKEEYGTCNHLKGKAYMGKMCAEVITEAELLEASVVEEPANKMCRTLSIEVNGINRDFMTLKIIHVKK